MIARLLPVVRRGHRLGRCCLGLCVGLFAFGAGAEPYYLIVAGLGGEERYDRAFTEQADSLAEAARRTTGEDAQVKVLRGEESTRDSLRGALDGLTDAMESTDTLIVFLIGHGSYDGETYKFNIPGPDVDGKELGEMLAGVPAASQLIVNATSASGAVLETWAGDGRTVVTATRSGAERNATRFAEHWAAALSSAEADIDKNGSITAQEAFDYASRKVADSYESEETLATEHPQIAGDAAARFTVARLTERTAQTPEIERLMTRLTDIEGEIEALRLRRGEMESSAYLDALQALLLQLALVQREIDEAQGDTRGNAGDGPSDAPGDASREAPGDAASDAPGDAASDAPGDSAGDAGNDVEGDAEGDAADDAQGEPPF